MSGVTVNVSKLQKSVGTPEIGADVKRPVAVCKSRIALEFACPIAPEFCICVHNPEPKWRCSAFCKNTHLFSVAVITFNVGRLAFCVVVLFQFPSSDRAGI